MMHRYQIRRQENNASPPFPRTFLVYRPSLISSHPQLMPVGGELGKDGLRPICRQVERLRVNCRQLYLFRDESASVFAALAGRIERENNHLYPLADDMRSVAAA
jgi:hypothetical protein